MPNPPNPPNVTDPTPPTPPTPEHDPRVYFALERTFLAWIRTGLGLMGVGFAVARFGLFLRQMGASAAPHTTGLSVLSGVVLVGIGVAVNLSAVARHILTVRELRSGLWIPGRVSKLAVALAVILAIIGIAMAIYLIVIR